MYLNILLLNLPPSEIDSLFPQLVSKLVFSMLSILCVDRVVTLVDWIVLCAVSMALRICPQWLQ